MWCIYQVPDELLNAFKFNDAILRHLVIRRDEAVTEASPLAKSEESESDAPAKPAAEKPAAEKPEVPKPVIAERPVTKYFTGNIQLYIS